MNMFRFLPTLLAATALCVTAAADEATHTIKFSDPSKPGTVRVSLGRGDLHVEGTDAAEVIVKSNASSDAAKPRKDGMRVISAASSFVLKESSNVVTLDAASDIAGRSNADFRLVVPRSTTVIVQNAWGGDITCTGINGDIEINSMRGEIRLDEVGGGVVVGTMNGEIRATIRALSEGRPLSFTSMNGEVVLRLPHDAKASVRLRTQNGSVLTDFDEASLVTKTEASPGFGRGRTPFMRGNKVLTTEIQDAIREATQMSATAIKEALEAVKEGLEAARLDSDDARRQMEEAKHEMERARREFERQQRDAERKGSAARMTPAPAAPATPDLSGPTTPNAPAAPKPMMPTITGGKLVTGTLNGGGPEISVATMNGDVILRKRESK